MEISIVSQKALATLTHPALDLLVGQLVELSPQDHPPPPQQLDLFSELITPLRLGLFGGIVGEGLFIKTNSALGYLCLGKFYMIDWEHSCIERTDCKLSDLAREFNVLKDEEEVA